MREYHSSERQESPAPTTTAGLVKKRRREFPSIRGMANRFSMAIGETDRIGELNNLFNSCDLSYEKHFQILMKLADLIRIS